jgi:hypothetical protein
LLDLSIWPGTTLGEIDHGAYHMVEVVHEDVKDDIGYNLNDHSIRQARIPSVSEVRVAEFATLDDNAPR